MTRPLPNCARCGETLRGKGRLILQWNGLPGRPKVGWCEHCIPLKEDLAFQMLKPDGEAQPGDPNAIDRALAIIAARGPGRVSYTKNHMLTKTGK